MQYLSRYIRVFPTGTDGGGGGGGGGYPPPPPPPPGPPPAKHLLILPAGKILPSGHPTKFLFCLHQRLIPLPLNNNVHVITQENLHF